MTQCPIVARPARVPFLVRHPVAIAPQTVAGGLPEGIAAVAVSEPTDSLETCLVWRNGERSPAVATFVAAARSAFSA